MDEQTMELFEFLAHSITMLVELKIIEMLASDKYTVSVKTFLTQTLMSIGNLAFDLSEITGKDETEFLEMMMNNNGGNGGHTGPVNPANPT